MERMPTTRQALAERSGRRRVGRHRKPAAEPGRARSPRGGAPDNVFGGLTANLGLALLLLGIVGSWFWVSPPDAPYRLGYALLGLTTTLLAAVALLRPPARDCDGRWWVYGVCVLAIAYANAYRFDSADFLVRLALWGRMSLQFVANMALLGLGRSYAMLPALREVRTGSFYRLVRHPVYALYLLADLGTVALQPSPWNAGVAVVGATCLFLRARLEERVLCRDPRYAEYMQVVRWRFLPGLY
jgi:protein-S-isoprenylcysteine O-methyltransferase Ste14